MFTPGGWLDELDLDSAKLDPKCRTVGDAQGSCVWKAKIDDAVADYNRSDECISRATSVRAWTILRTDFSPKVELTPTLKLKRDVVHATYTREIKQLCASVDSNPRLAHAPVSRSSNRVSHRRRQLRARAVGQQGAAVSVLACRCTLPHDFCRRRRGATMTQNSRCE